MSVGVYCVEEAAEVMVEVPKRTSGVVVPNVNAYTPSAVDVAEVDINSTGITPTFFD